VTTSTLRLTPGDIVRIRTERWRVAAHLPFGTCAFVDVSGAEASNNGRRARFVLPFEPIEPLVADARPQVVRPARVRRIACGHLADAVPSSVSLQTAARAAITLMPFQLEPALAVTHGLASRLLIADAVGLGKTIQAGLVVAEVLARTIDGHALIVTPAALREQWLHELHSRFAIDAASIDATTTARADVHANPWTTHAASIASIDYVKRPEVLRGLEEMVWDVVVFDEAHWLAGRSVRAQAASEIAARARIVVALTATPHAGDERAFNRLCDLGELAGDGPLAFFRRSRRQTALADTRRMSWLHVTPAVSERRMHDALASYTRTVWQANLSPGARLAMGILARRACSSAHALVRSLERRLALLATDTDLGLQLSLPLQAMDSDEEPIADLAARGLEDASRECRQLEELLTIARMACRGESKLDRLERLLSRTRDAVIVFTEYRDTLERLAAALHHHNPAQLHGGMTLGERRDGIRGFTSGSTRVLLATDAGSEGLNLHYRCRLVINLEVPWTPLRLEQRVGRVDRIGQNRRVHAVQMIARDTPEDTVLRRLIHREWRARASLDAIAHLDAAAVADAALGSAVLVPRDSAPLPARVAAIDLRESAVQEAQRLETARQLLSNAGSTMAHRPAVAVVSRHRAARRAYWAYQVTMLSSDEEWVWQALIGLTHLIPMQTFHLTRNVREVLDATVTSVTTIADAARVRAAAAFLADTRRPIASAAVRERAIQRQITARQSTMAATLVQRGLFDARHERQAAAESARLTVAAERCAIRLRALRRIEAAHASVPQLVFAMLTQ
jgi:ERCC4-related helicase